MRPRWRRRERIGEQPWYRRPSPRTGVISARWPRVYIFSIGVSSAWSAKSYRYSPWRFGAAALWAAMKRISLPRNASAKKGRVKPPKFDPPPRLETLRHRDAEGSGMLRVLLEEGSPRCRLRTR